MRHADGTGNIGSALGHASVEVVYDVISAEDAQHAAGVAEEIAWRRDERGSGGRHRDELGAPSTAERIQEMTDAPVIKGLNTILGLDGQEGRA